MIQFLVDLVPAVSMPFLLAPFTAAFLSSFILYAQAPIEFLPDDAQVACRAILPQCFTRSGWARLCLANPTIGKTFSKACDLALE